MSGKWIQFVDWIDIVLVPLPDNMFNLHILLTSWCLWQTMQLCLMALPCNNIACWAFYMYTFSMSITLTYDNFSYQWYPYSFQWIFHFIISRVCTCIFPFKSQIVSIFNVIVLIFLTWIICHISMQLACIWYKPQYTRWDFIK